MPRFAPSLASILVPALLPALLLAVLSSASAQTLPDYLPTDGLVAWYPLDGTGSNFATELEGAFSDLAFAGGGWSENRNNEPNTAFSPASGRGYTTGLDWDFGWNSVFTTSVWFTRTPGAYGNGRLISTECPEGNYRIGNWSDGGGIAVQMGSYIMVPLNNTPDWVHLVHVMDHGVERVYIDGVLQGVYQEEAYENQTYCSPFTVGAKAAPAFDPWPGLIDDIGIWNRALTDAEVMALYLGEPPVVGCTDPTACNFNPEANTDDGSCVPSGCLDAAACNFNAAAGCGGVECDFMCCPGPGCCGEGMVWDAALQHCVLNEEFVEDLEVEILTNALVGVCGTGTVWNPLTASCVSIFNCVEMGWNPDSNGDYVITIVDLLAFLSVFEDSDFDGDGIFDSQDECVGYLDPCGACNGSGQDADFDGVCDVVDLCVGASSTCCVDFLESNAITFLGSLGSFDYFSVGDSLTWFESNFIAQCLGPEVQLAVIHSADLNALLTSWTIGRAMPWHWIGLYQDLLSPDYSEPGGAWKWVDGSPLDFVSWGGGEPSNGNGVEHHGQINHPIWGAGTWNDGMGDVYKMSAILQAPHGFSMPVQIH